ncbi:MAG: hypothetical protein ACR2RF_30100 [Geminicoccaceae bacterium]
MRSWRLAQQKAEAAELARLRRENRRIEQKNEILKGSAAFVCTRGRDMKYAFIATERATFPVRRPPIRL